MSSGTRQRITYVTTNDHKMTESRVFQERCVLSNGLSVSDSFDLEYKNLKVKEVLEVDLEEMVIAEVTMAYGLIHVPCFVEHAGLIFEPYFDVPYPGGLTKPMWNALKDHFVEETHSADRRAIARAVVAYCDGMRVRTFRGETTGSIAASPRGALDFYWDTVFVPDDPSGKSGGKTYAEIVEDRELGLAYKMQYLSQSGRAMGALFEYLLVEGPSPLWSGIS